MIHDWWGWDGRHRERRGWTVRLGRSSRVGRGGVDGCEVSVSVARAGERELGEYGCGVSVNSSTYSFGCVMLD